MKTKSHKGKRKVVKPRVFKEKMYGVFSHWGDTCRLHKPPYGKETLEIHTQNTLSGSAYSHHLHPT